MLKEGTFSDSIQSLIESRDSYSAYRFDHNTKELPQPDPTWSTKIALKAAVAAIIAYFWAQDYKFSADLLIHAEKNNDSNSTYYPMFHSRVETSSVFQRIKNGPHPASGSDAFLNEGDPTQRDLHYAIHRFDWLKPNSMVVVISDRYDFEFDLNYTGIAGTAVNTMAMAQALGVIVPYNVYMNFYERNIIP